MTKPTGYILWNGLSPYDGSPIVAILTVRSTNRKTGDLPQVWILHRDLHPVEALTTGWDAAVCGDCPHRGNGDGTGRSCYVEIGKAPASVWRAYQRGSYPAAPEGSWHWYLMLAAIGSRAIRWGAYGDPGMLPAHLVERVNACAGGGHRGYTHQWRQPWAAWTAGTFMASCDTPDDVLAAATGGWRTFSVVPQGATAWAGKLCPATVPGSRATCATCTQCDGKHSHIWVEAHGAGAKNIG